MEGSIDGDSDGASDDDSDNEKLCDIDFDIENDGVCENDFDSESDGLYDGMDTRIPPDSDPNDADIPMDFGNLPRLTEDFGAFDNISTLPGFAS